MMDKYTYADVIIDPDDPRVEIGAEYYYNDYPAKTINDANIDYGSGFLKNINKSDIVFPFEFNEDNDGFACLIRKKEPKKKWAPFDLSKPEVRDKLRGKWIRRPEGDEEKLIWWFWRDNAGRWYVDEDISARELLDDWVFMYDNDPCGEEVTG